jgi:hypothetical protein
MTMKRHALDPVSLLCGLVFAGLALSLMTGVMSPAPRHLNLIWPAAVVLLGIALLASGRERRHPGTAAPEAADVTATAPLGDPGSSSPDV